MRGSPSSHESFRSSYVSRRLRAFASAFFSAYSAHTACEDWISLSQGVMYRNRLGISWSSSWLMPLRKCVMPVLVCFATYKSDCGIRM